MASFRIQWNGGRCDRSLQSESLRKPRKERESLRGKNCALQKAGFPSHIKKIETKFQTHI